MNILQKYADFLPFTHKIPFEFSANGTMGVGGIAPIALFPQDEQELLQILSVLTERKLSFVVVGNLSNTLVAEGAIEHVVICTKQMRFCRSYGRYLYAESGVTSGRLLHRCIDAGLSGAEFLSGIPCTLGGAVYMNAGVSGEYISSIVDSVRVFRDGKVQIVRKADCEFAYKNSIFMRNNDILLGVTLQLMQSSPCKVREEIARYHEKRAHLPIGKSLGCIFKNPEGQIAGRLIEGAGLKGMRIGGAVVSDVHANFIINDKGATAQDIRALIQIIKNAVYAQYKIALQEEIRYLE